MKYQGNMIPPKNHNNLSATDPKDMKFYDLPHKEFKIAILRKLSKLQETTEKPQQSDKKKARHLN